MEEKRWCYGERSLGGLEFWEVDFDAGAHGGGDDKLGYFFWVDWLNQNFKDGTFTFYLLGNTPGSEYDLYFL